METVNLKFNSSFISDKLVDVMEYVSISDDYMWWIIGFGIIERMGRIDNLNYGFTRTVWLDEELGYTWENRGKFSVMRVIGGMIIKDNKWYYFLSFNGSGIDIDAYHSGAVLGLISWYYKFITKKTLV